MKFLRYDRYDLKDVKATLTEKWQDEGSANCFLCQEHIRDDC